MRWTICCPFSRLTARCGRCSTVVQTDDRKVGEQMNPTRFILG